MDEVWVNGNQGGAQLWLPFKFEIRDFVLKGKNKIKVRIRNLI
jgi:hypothetical protein